MLGIKPASISVFHTTLERYFFLDILNLLFNVMLLCTEICTIGVQQSLAQACATFMVHKICGIKTAASILWYQSISGGDWSVSNIIV